MFFFYLWKILGRLYEFVVIQGRDVSDIHFRGRLSLLLKVLPLTVPFSLLLFTLLLIIVTACSESEVVAAAGLQSRTHPVANGVRMATNGCRRFSWPGLASSVPGNDQREGTGGG